MYQLVEGDALAGDARRRAAAGRIDVAETDDTVDEQLRRYAKEDPKRFLRQVCGTRADAIVVGGEHHVLSAAAGIERMFLRLRDDDDGASVGKPAGEGAQPG